MTARSETGDGSLAGAEVGFGGDAESGCRTETYMQLTSGTQEYFA